MNYYEKTLIDIKELIEKGNKEEAIRIIEEELKAPYLPKDFNDEILKIYNENKVSKSFSLSDDDLAAYLKDSKEKQLIAVSVLNKKNLRDYLDLCNEYLCSDGFINAKVLLVDSLIRQEINEEIKMENNGIEYSFIPKYILLVEESDGFIEGSKMLNEHFLKEPSKASLAIDLLYKELMLSLPINISEEECPILVNNIIGYIEKAFDN